MSELFRNEAELDRYFRTVSHEVLTSTAKAETFETCLVEVAEVVKRNGTGKRFVVDRLQNIATAAGLVDENGDDWVQERIEGVFRHGGLHGGHRRDNGKAAALRNGSAEAVDQAAKPKFVLEPFDAIKFDSAEEWTVKRLISRQGVGVLFGASQSLKSFTAVDLAVHVSLGREWAGRRVTASPAVYIAAEGAAGLRKRKVGFERAHADLPPSVPFYMISAAPNLGAERGDLDPLIASIEAAGVKPGLIVIDTLAQSLGGADENGAGMVQLVANATAIANHFRAFALIVHHVGLTDDKRLRGHTSLVGGVDVSILCERMEGTFSTVLTLQKLKDDESNTKFTAYLSRIVIGQDEDGDEVTTLVVDRIEHGDAVGTRKASKPIPAGQRLLMEVVAVALDEAGTIPRPLGESGPAVAETAVRTRYYARIAEQAEPDEDRKKLADRQKKAFKRSVEAALKATVLKAGQRDGERILWLP